MRGVITFIAVMAIGALVAAVISRWTDGYVAGFATGVLYMLIASIALNSCSARRV